MSTNLTHLFGNIQLVCLGLHQKKNMPFTRHSLGIWFQSLWTLSMGFLPTKIQPFPRKMAWFPSFWSRVGMDLKIIWAPKFWAEQKNKHWENDAILRCPTRTRILLQSIPVWTKNMKKIHSKVVRFKGSTQPQFTCCTMGKPTLKGKFVLLHDPLQLFHWPLWVQVSPGAWFSWWSATRFQRAAPIGWNLESQVCCIYGVDFSNYSRIDDGWWWWQVR